ncbi:MAG TPA: hypothetical protein ENJ18_16160 [Nannocystis exedens]|nr:hypothetical protein [Nannocystis exedens]
MIRAAFNRHTGTLGPATSQPLPNTLALPWILRYCRGMCRSVSRVLVVFTPVMLAAALAQVLAGSKCFHSLVYEASDHSCLRPILDHEPAIPE